MKGCSLLVRNRHLTTNLYEFDLIGLLTLTSTDNTVRPPAIHFYCYAFAQLQSFILFKAAILHGKVS